ncbi:MAG: helix-turn-helix domain-containing protein [Mycobacterium sp.]
MTHVLLPASMLVRRGWSATIVWSALALRGQGWGHRRIAVAVGVPVGTVRGWLRRMAGRLEPVRAVFLAASAAAGIDQPVPVGAGGPWRDMLAAVGAAMAAITARFGPAGLLGEVTAAGVAVACSTGRLLSPDWPGRNGSGFATRVAPAEVQP